MENAPRQALAAAAQEAELALQAAGKTGVLILRLTPAGDLVMSVVDLGNNELTWSAKITGLGLAAIPGMAVLKGIKRAENTRNTLATLSRQADNASDSAAKFVFDARVDRYRDVGSGRYVAARDLPWPSNAGFTSSTRQTVHPGTILDRYGNPTGRFLGEPGSTISARGMAPGSEGMPYTRYRVLKPFDAQVGPAAGVVDFGAVGGATQYLPGQTVQWLIDNGFLEVIR